MLTLPNIVQDMLFHEMRKRRAAYKSLEDENGNPLGPLVQYSAKYDDDHHWVGFAYYNYALIEGTPSNLLFANSLAATIIQYGVPDGIYGSPMGGLTLSQATATALWDQGYHDLTYGFPDEEVIKLKTKTTRKESKFIAGRHPIIPGKKYGIGEDVLNNFNSTTKMADVIEGNGGIVAFVFCAVDRAWPVKQYFERPGKAPIEIIAAIDRPTLQFHQDDPAVADLIAQDNIIRDPKKQWDILEAAMAA